MNVNLIAAVGDNGEIGLSEGLPWERDQEDMRFFYEQTRGGSLIMGARTARALNWHESQILSGGRIVFHYHGADPLKVIEQIQQIKPHSAIWICGGTFTYRMFLPYVRRCFITRNKYNGNADSFMPPLWGQGSF